MTTSTPSAGGFIGDPAQAFTPPSAGGCCGSTPAATDTVADNAAASPCCGTTAQATEASSCCGTAAKAEAVASSQGCCG